MFRGFGRLILPGGSSLPRFKAMLARQELLIQFRFMSSSAPACDCEALGGMVMAARFASQLTKTLFGDDRNHTKCRHWVCPPPAKERVERKANKQNDRKVCPQAPSKTIS